MNDFRKKLHETVAETLDHLWFYRNNIGVEHTDFKPADFDGAVRSAIEKLKQEAAKSLA